MGGEGCKKKVGDELGEVMDTPERGKNGQIAPCVGNFEESPVFNFLNNLSPIKPVKSTHITQTINPLSFASLPSVFTSPHVSSLRESRFLRRHQLSDPSKPEFSSDDGSKVDTSKLNVDATQNLKEQKENLDPRVSNGEVAVEPSNECPMLVVPSAQHAAEQAFSTSTIVPFVQEGTLFTTEGNLEDVSKIDQNDQSTSCDWENLISDTSDFLIFESPDDRESYQKPVDPATSFYTNIKNAMHNMQSLGTAVSVEQVGDACEPENLPAQPIEGNEMMENEELSGLYRGMRRRCLVFERGGAHSKHLQENPISDSSLLLQPDSSTTFSQQLAPRKTITDPSCRVLPGIGLHLNALAATAKINNHEASSSGRLLIGPSTSANFHSPISDQGFPSNTMAVSSLEREIDTLENRVLPVDNAMATEEITQTSPKKKRRRSEQVGEGESCKRCNCKKSKCLKLYCECFAAGVYCVEPCACIDCFNKPVHEDTVLATRKQIESRNPLAFAPKVIKSSDSLSEIGEDSSKTPASARHKRGCNCKKSGCSKKYCECYQGGVGCSINCRCEGCRNVFGRKDGMDAEYEEDETDMVEKQIVDSAPPATPIRAGSQPLIQPFSSKKKPPRSSFPSVSSSSKPSFFQPQTKLDKHFENVREDEMPEFLQSGSPIKSASPNRKRVFSPPQGSEMSPAGLRSSRKLILRSIPSFPSLNNHQ